MEYEDFLTEIYTPLKSIEVLSEIIYKKFNEDWDFKTRESADELIALNFLTELCAKHLLKNRRKVLDEIYN